MKLRQLANGFAVVMLLAVYSKVETSVSAEESSNRWNDDLRTAQHLATENNKDILILFTGHGWCQACEVLHQKVVYKPEFLDVASQHFELVELDFTFNSATDSAATKADLQKLQKHYLVNGFPCLVLVDENATAYAHLLAPDPELGAAGMLKWLLGAKSGKQSRDAFFLAARQATGKDRAIALHQGLDSIDKYLKRQESGEDFLLSFYGPEVRELLDLTEVDDAIHASYAARMNARPVRARQFSTQLLRLLGGGEYLKALNAIDEELSHPASNEDLASLYLFKQKCLENLGRLEESVALCRSASPAILSDDDVWELRIAELRCLLRLNHISESIGLYDRLITLSKHETKPRQRLLALYAAHLDSSENYADASLTWMRYRDEFEIGTSKWLTGSIAGARSLSKCGKQNEAMDVFQTIASILDSAALRGEELEWPWAPQRSGYVHVEIAKCQIALGNFEEATASLQRIDECQQELSRSENETERNDAERLAQMLIDLRNSIAEKQGRIGEE